MKRRLVSSQPEAAEVNITPLLDIVFILLIFFIVTATFLQESGIGLIAPQDEPPEKETRPPPTMVLTVQKDGFVLVDDVRLVDPRSVKPIIEAFKAIIIRFKCFSCSFRSRLIGSSLFPS